MSVHKNQGNPLLRINALVDMNPPCPPVSHPKPSLQKRVNLIVTRQYDGIPLQVLDIRRLVEISGVLDPH
jgi:hypothetical protein